MPEPAPLHPIHLAELGQVKPTPLSRASHQIQSAHSLAWVSWLVAGLVALSSTRNPLYLLISILCISIVLSILRSRPNALPTPISPFRFSLIVLSLSTLFNGLTSHYGTTVLFTIPGSIPLLSGPVTLEALVYGAINGLVLCGMLLAFLTLNLALPVRSLIRLIPRAFHPVAVITAIAVTYVPATMRQFQQVREAQTLRGHRLRKARDWLPLMLPLLIGGLERALQLSEAMAARGFSSSQAQPSLYSRGLILAGLLFLIAGWLVRLNSKANLLGFVSLLFGSALVLGSLWRIGRQAPRSTYRKETWQWFDWYIFLGAVLVISTYLFSLPWLSQATLIYLPYPTLSLPPFDPFIGLSTLGLLTPLLAIWRHGAV